MRNPSNKLLALLCGLVLAAGIIAAKVPTESKQYDYLSIVQRDEELQISGSKHPFEKVKVKNGTGIRDSNYEALFDKVNEFEAQGYELVHNNVYTLGEGAITRNYVLLRKPRQ